MLQIDPENVDTFDVEKAMTAVKNEMMDEEYIYMSEDLGRKQGLNTEIEEKEDTSDPKDVAKLAEYLFLTKQMGWKKGFKVLQEKGEEAIETELQQIHDMEGFTQK